MDRFSLLLVIIGAINWGLVGLFQFDLIAFLFGGQAALVSRVLYTIVGAAGLWSISMLFSPRETTHGRRERLTEAQKTEKLFSLPCGGEYFYHLSRSWGTFAQKC